MDVCFLEEFFSVVPDNYTHPEVGVTPTFAFIVTICVWFLGGLDRKIDLQGLDLPFNLDNRLLHCDHCRVLGCHFIGIICHLYCQVHVGVSEVSHFRPVLCYGLGEVCKVFLDNQQVVGSVSALARCLLTLSEVGLPSTPSPTPSYLIFSSCFQQMIIIPDCGIPSLGRISLS